MTARTLGAIAACARTLAGATDVDDALADAASLTTGPLRAAADRAAIARRFHDPLAHAALRPREAAAAALFDALEAARLDARGARWLAGIARNLLACPGPDDDGMRWLAFERFSGRPAPSEKARAAAEARVALPATLATELDASHRSSAISAGSPRRPRPGRFAPPA